MIKQQELIVSSLGECRFRSPLSFDSPSTHHKGHYASDVNRIRYSIVVPPVPDELDDLSFEEAGPREMIFFDPAETTAAVVTCGGLSPGLNNVIRSLFYELTENYKVKKILGIRNGYLGLNPESGRAPITLTHDVVGEIHKLGGTVLGSSRGAQAPKIMVDFLVSEGINILFCLGGDGTQRGAEALHQEVVRRGLSISVVGIPKTIDNDIPFVRQTFGYATALEKASEVIRGAHVEARDAINGIGLVKLMGRNAGFIAAGASIVSQEVNFTLVPEIPFPLEGETGFLASLERRIRERGHAVIVVAEGAGQHLLRPADERRDASGNVLRADIGVFLREKIQQYCASRDYPVTLKYLDPSYHIRSVPANAYDCYLCDQMARHAAHAAMAGRTGVLIGFEHNQFLHVPIPAVVAQEKKMDVTGDLWRAVLQVTRQPRW
jgi:6-phosphofructokinase 1